MTNEEFTDSVKQKELFEYIKRQIQNGVSAEEVKNVLLKAGWHESDINKAFEVLNNSNNQNILNNTLNQPQEAPKVVLNENQETKQEKNELKSIIERNNTTDTQTKNDLNLEKTVLVGTEFLNKNEKPKISVKTLIIFAAIIIIFGTGAVASGYFYFRSPEGILERMLANLMKVKSAEYSGKIKINITGGSFYPMIVGENKEHYFAINFDGASDNYDENNPLGHFYFDIESDLSQQKTPFSIESRILKDNVYFKLNGLSDLGFLGVFDLSPLFGQWIDINIKNLEKQYNLEQKDFKKKNLTEDDIKNLEKFVKEHKIFKEIEKLPSERVNGKDAYHLKFNIDKENLKNYFSEIIKIYYKDINKTYIEIGVIQKIINNAFDALDFSGIEIWIGKKDYLLYKFSAAVDFSDKKTKDSGKISISAAFKNYNKPVKVEIPQNAKPFEEIMKSFWNASGLNLYLPPCDITQDKKKGGCIESKSDSPDLFSLNAARMKARDASRIADIRMLQLSFELYFDDNGFYPSSLNKIAPEYIKEIPIDPLDKKPYFYNPHISDGLYGALGNVPKGKFDGYHIGANLENKNSALLKDDRDCNSITGINCNFESGYVKTNAFDGGDTKGCGGQENRYCYDVEN